MQDNFTDICWNMKYFHNLKSMTTYFQDILHGCLEMENILILIFWALEFCCYFTELLPSTLWLQQHNNAPTDAHICIAILINYCSFRNGWYIYLLFHFQRDDTFLFLWNHFSTSNSNLQKIRKLKLNQ